MTLYILIFDITKKIKFGKILLLLGIFASLLFMLLLGVGNFENKSGFSFFTP
jgi:hypothetical protein